MADKPPGRPMKFPYTFSAQLVQFPWKHYFGKQWMWKYYGVAFFVCMPVFYKIGKLSNSPDNVAKWAEIRRRDAQAAHH